MAACPVKVGDVVAGKFLVERVLGAGGMGVVVAARHQHLDQRVALKFLLPEAAQVKGVVERFLREGRAAVKISSEHVVRVFDVGVLPTGSPFLVMEYLEGTDVSAEIRREGRLQPAKAVEYVLQACEAIASAHALGIVHRDLKPANLFLAACQDGTRTIKVLDFGISKLQDDKAGLTTTSAVMGSPLYMSPEQVASSRDVDARTDIWSIGIVLYEMLSGRTPFAGESIAQLYHKLMNEPPPPLQLFGVPEGLEAAIFRCLQKDREDRYSDLSQFASAIVSFGGGSSRASADRIARLLKPSAAMGFDDTVPSDANVRVPSETSTTGNWSQTAGAPRIRARRVAAASVSTVLVLGLTVGVLALRRAQHAGAPQGQDATSASAPHPAPVLASVTAASAMPAALVAPSASAGPADGGSPEAGKRSAPKPAPARFDPERYPNPFPH